MTERLKRNQVPEKMTWDTDALFKSNEAFYQTLKEAEEDTEKLLAYKGKLLESPEILYQGIVDLEKLIVKLSALGTFTGLKQSVDATDTSNQELAMTFSSAATKIQADITFFDNEISSIGKDKYDTFFKEEPKLETYRPFIEELYEKSKYKLSDDAEELLAALGEVTEAPFTTYSISKAADMQFDDIKDSKGKILPNSFALFEGKYEFSDDPVLRKNAYESFNKTLEQYKNTYASVYATEVKKQVTLSKLRGYESVTDMLLEEQKVTKEMYHRQIDVIYNELAPHMRKFADLLKKELNLDKVNFYDLKAPMDTSYNPSATFDEAKEVVLKSLEIMGEEYLSIMNRAFDERWIDYADNIGKRTGAFCASPYAAHPYVFMTFQDNMRDAFTLTHELGHAGHFYLANKEQVFLNTRPSRYTVEAPSTMNEMLLGRYLLANNDDKQLKKWVILQFMGTYYHNFVTHLLEAAYQRKVYDFAEAGTPLTAKLLCDTKLEVIRGFWGDSVEVDDHAGMTWMRQPHYYMGLYPYTYSAGLTASTAVSEMIFEEGQAAIDRWLEMLRTGGKLKPLDLLKVAGMDLSSDAPVQKAVAYVGSLIDQLIELCD
ncbi:oligoendopeptidase F [Acidaminobacter sp. JC074]|uniref:oligoendopeptidase F n=1 Tax=Acidaminobacter sp. JC074 TaxID=2530199 RepID=UPI001F0F3203|nr:oligoendopeptidase F [Acidaminobacter sp. JC074]MCH4888396.1 oligoendopeptidase F [Acidaminobacter sp. JC074]